MAFGQSSGPPATGKQLRELVELLEAAGHSDFRDARGPMGFTQRQAGGKFTRDEADEFIERLEEEVHGSGTFPAAPAPSPASAKPAARPRSTSKTTANAAPNAATKAAAKATAKPTSKTASGSKPAAASKPAARSVADAAPDETAKPAPKKVMTLAEIPAERLAAELQRRGWVVLEP